MMQDRGISVEGHGQISVSPDVAHVTLGVEREGSDLESIRFDADERMNSMIDALIELGIEESDIRTIVYDIWVRDDRIDPMSSEPRTGVDEAETPESPTSEDDDEEMTDDDAVTDEDEDEDAEIEPDVDTQTYVLTQLVQVRVADIDMTGEVIDTALDNGANRVSNISFEIEDRQGAIEQAREIAVDEARAKAEHLASLTDVSLGSPLRIDEHSPSGAVMRMEMEDVAMDMDAADGEMMSRIEPGEQVISVYVYITYGID